MASRPVIYVGVPMWPFGRMIMCHMFVARHAHLDALHEMAQGIGIRRRWFQNRPSLPHYDISKGKRAEAIKMGAIPLDTIEAEASMLEIAMERFRA